MSYGQVDDEDALGCTCAWADAIDSGGALNESGKAPGSVKHQVAEGRESGDPGKGPPAHCKTCSLHRKHAIELCLQEYTSES